MSNKTIKIIITVVTVLVTIAGILYFFKSHKNKEVLCEEPEDTDTEETLDATDALDLSSLKFSRHYVDLR